MADWPGEEYPAIDFDALNREEEWLWKPTPRLRWHRPKGGNDNDIVLEQMYERITGECLWRPVQTILEN